MAEAGNGAFSAASSNAANGFMTVAQVTAAAGIPSKENLNMPKSEDSNLAQKPPARVINQTGNSGLVCVTGGTGYIASSLIARLLQLGYVVRTTVRCLDASKVAHLLDLDGAKERLTFYKAELTNDGAFDKAIDGVEGVFHCAGPVIPNDPNGDPEVVMVDPCVNGTLNVLRACTKAGSVRKVVMTSSCSAIRYNYSSARRIWAATLDENDWSNEYYCREHEMWYALGKTKAESIAWKFAKEHNVNLITVNPSYVLGKFLGNVPTSTISYMKKLLTGEVNEYPNQIIGFVHIQDVVTAHILLYESPEAEGRYICSATVAHWSEVMKAIRARYPMLKKLPMKCKSDNHEVIHHDMSSNKIRKLGLTRFQSLTAMIEDLVEDFREKGLLPEYSPEEPGVHVSPAAASESKPPTPASTSMSAAQVIGPVAPRTDFVPLTII